MPNYFQNLKYTNNVNKSLRGCTSGARTPDGKSPANASDSYCVVYNTQKDELEQTDSCTNVKRLETTQCFRASTTDTKVLQANFKGSPYVQCTHSQTNITETHNTYDANASAEALQQKQLTAQRNAIVKVQSQGSVTALNAGDIQSLSFITLVIRRRTDLPSSQLPPFLQAFFHQSPLAAPNNIPPINISQIVIRDQNGVNIAPSCTISSSSVGFGTSLSTINDGQEVARPYPSIFHSQDGDNEWVSIPIPHSVTISSITIFNRSDCCGDRLSNYRLTVGGNTLTNLSSELVQTFTFFSTPIQPNMVTQDIFTPENVTYSCTEIESYKSWIESIRILYPYLYATYSSSLDSSQTWSADKKNTFCNILEQTKIQKTMTDTQLKEVSIL